jgi:hypothetical protein
MIETKNTLSQRLFDDHLRMYGMNYLPTKKDSDKIFDFFIDRVREIGTSFERTQYFECDVKTHISDIKKQSQSIIAQSSRNLRHVRLYGILRNAGFVTLVLAASLLAVVYLEVDALIESTFGVVRGGIESIIEMSAAIVLPASLLCVLTTCYLWMAVDRGASQNA